MLRLRRQGGKLCKEAADTIEALRAAIQKPLSLKRRLGLLEARRENPDLKLGGYHIAA